MSRGQAVDTRLEKLIPATNEWFTSGLYTKDEIHGIMKQRTNFEYRLAARPLLMVDVELAVDYEMTLERHIQDYTAKNKLKLKHRWSVVERCEKIYKIGMQRLKTPAENKKTTNAYIALLKRFNRTTELSRHFAFKIQKWPNEPEFWIQAIEWELETNSKYDNARSLGQEGLRNNPGSVALWCLALKLELKFADKMLFTIRDQHWSEYQAKLKKATSVAVEPLDGDIIADLVREENEALGKIVVDLELAKVILATGFASDAFSTDLILGFYNTAIQFRCSGDLVVDHILKDGLQLMVEKAVELDEKHGIDHVTGVRLVAPQLVNKKVNPILGVISQLPTTLATHQLLSVRECFVLPPPEKDEDEEIADAKKKKGQGKKAKGDDEEAPTYTRKPKKAKLELRELTADEKVDHLLQSMSLFHTLVQESTTTTLHPDDDDDAEDDYDAAAKRRLQIQHEALKVVVKAQRGDVSVRRKTLSDYVWSVVLGHHHAGAAGSGKKKTNSAAAASWFEAAPLCPLLADLSEWLVSVVRDTPLPCFVQPANGSDDDGAALPRSATVGIAGHNSTAVTLQDLTSLCLPFLEEGKLVLLTKSGATRAGPAPDSQQPQSKSLPAFLLLVESLKSPLDVKTLLTQQASSGGLSALVLESIDQKAVALWKLFALCHAHGVPLVVGTSFKKAGGANEQKSKKKVQSARSKRNRGDISESDSDADSSSSDDEEDATPGAGAKLSPTLVCAVRVIGGMSVGTLASNDERKEREVALIQLVSLALLDIKAGSPTLGLKEAAALYRDTIAPARPENLHSKEQSSNLGRVVKDIIGLAACPAEMVPATMELLSLVSQFPPVPDAVLLKVAAPFYCKFTKDGKNKARSCFETTVAATTAGVTTKGLGGVLSLNSSVSVEQIVDRWVQYVLFERILTKDLVRSQELVRRANKALGTSTQQFQIRLTNLGNQGL